MGGFLRSLAAAAFLLGAGCVTPPPRYEPAMPSSAALFELQTYNEQATGIALSRTGRIFLNFPRWDRDPASSVVELLPDGTLKPYPNQEWNRWRRDASLDPASRFVCVQSLFVDDSDVLWILDPASPAFAGVVPGGAKLVKVDLATDSIVQVIPFDEKAAPPKSYLNDIRVDPVANTGYITDSGIGAILVVDLKSGNATRRLYDHPSTKAEPGYVPVIGGRKLLDASGRPPQIHADGIALDAAGKYLYYHALTGTTLYRIGTEQLRDFSLDEGELGRKVERLGATGAVDGMLIDDADNLYLTALEGNGILRRSPDGSLKTIASDPRIRWPDSMALSVDRYLYFTASQIDLMPRFNSGVDRRVLPYRLFRIWLDPL
jgi:sugar lactone lactonase YvrE